MLGTMERFKTLVTRGNLKRLSLSADHPLRVAWEHGTATDFLGMNFLELHDALSRAAQDAQRAPRLTCDSIEYQAWGEL